VIETAGRIRGGVWRPACTNNCTYRGDVARFWPDTGGTCAACSLEHIGVTCLVWNQPCC